MSTMAANQARRRTGIDSASIIDSGSQPPEAFIYQPLDPDPDADSVRLVLIEPAIDDDDPLSCTLINVKFAEKRRFKALSYMWGNEAVKETIFLNGVKFHVGRNLWDAVHYLRRSSNQMPFWIDAICINQQDIPERNRQLAMMKYIYFRADTVVIWLGKKYSRYQLRTGGIHQEKPQESGTVPVTTTKPGEKSETLALGLNNEGGVKASNEEREMVKELCADGYWDRLWIIQEIGRARQKEVCFGNLAMDWNAFIEIATLHNTSYEGPLRLKRLLQDKYSGSHTLRKLLYDHREALCKEPRDKIYGLVGLAADAVEFPMDYSKSLINVWTDTMEFMNCQGLLPESDVIPFGGLVKSLLIGANLGPLEQALQPYEPRPNSTLTIEDLDSSRAFQLQGYVIGCITAVGPCPAEIISSLRKADQWAAQIQQNFQKELGQAHRENDTLMRFLLESDETHLASACFSHVSTVRWKQDWYHQVCLRTYGEKAQETKAKYTISSQSRSEKSPNDTLLSARNSHLFLIKNYYRGETPWKMGIASSLAQPGDLVCWIHGVQRALIVRPTFRDATWQIFGTALFTDDFSLNDKASHANRLSWFTGCGNLTLKMDAATIYVLLA
jgi:hypothetical protein